MNGWIIVLIILIVLGAACGVGWYYLEKEHAEARSLPLNAVDFSSLLDGTYEGSYAGGMYKWRTNECVVTVSDGARQ